MIGLMFQRVLFGLDANKLGDIEYCDMPIVCMVEELDPTVGSTGRSVANYMVE